MMDVSKIVMVPIGKIKPYAKNARINDHVVPELMNSIRRFGFLQPIVLSKDGTIAAGHTRLKAAKGLGMTSVPCIYADELTQDEIDAYRLADNKISEMSMWDMGMLDDELERLKGKIDMVDFGFKDIESGIDPEGEAESEPMPAAEEEKCVPHFHKCPACGEVFED